jgi:hypothetical protein
MALPMPGVEFATLLVSVSMAAFAIVSLVRLRRGRRQGLTDDDLRMSRIGRSHRLTSFLDRRGRRYMWGLLAVSAFLAYVCIANLVLYYR